MTDLLPGHTVIAVDLSGLGDTTGDLPSHRKTDLARYVHLLLGELDYTGGSSSSPTTPRTASPTPSSSSGASSSSACS